jgi:hypothetical protein
MHRVTKIIGKNTLDVFFLLLVSLIGIGSVVGVPLPLQFPILSFHPFELTTFDSGFALYQTQRPNAFFTLTPFNDFFIPKEGFRSALLPVDIFEQKKYSTSLQNRTIIPQVWAGIQAYLGNLPLNYSLTTTNYSVQYSTATQAEDPNRFTVVRILTFNSPKALLAQGQTLATGELDLVIEPQTRKVFSRINDDQRQWLGLLDNSRPWQEQVLPPEATQSADFVWAIETGELAVISPNMVGGVVVKAQIPQSLIYNPNTRLIEVIERTPSETQTTFQIQTHFHTFSDWSEVTQ